MKQKLLLLDADVIIYLHEEGKWCGILSNYDVYVSSIVVKEAETYTDPISEVIKAINLQQYIKKGEITEIDASVEELGEVSQKLKVCKSSIDPGELECVTVIYKDKVEDLRLCLRDHAAIAASKCLDISDKTISIERMLKEGGLLRKRDSVTYENSQNRFDKYLLEGAFLAVESLTVESSE